MDDGEEIEETESAPAGDSSAKGEPVRIPIESVLDLHAFRPSDVRSVTEEYLSEARQAGLERVRIVHGRGVGVQREIVRSVLAQCPFVLDFSDAPGEAGGWGATIVVLRRL